MTDCAPLVRRRGTTTGPPLELLVDVSHAVPGDRARHVAVDVFLPPLSALEGRPTVLCCVPGGGVDRRYYDLHVPRDPTYSFARHLATAGFVVLTADHLGVGESTPVPPEELTVEALAAGAHEAMRGVIAALARGALDAAVPAIDCRQVVGVGHSMGAMLTVLQQAAYRSYDSIALLGFGCRGLPDFLPPAVAALAGDPGRLRLELPALLRTAGPSGAGERRSRSRGTIDFHGRGLAPDVVAAVKAIAAPAPPLAAMLSMVPGSVLAEMAALDVPVLLANGEHDITEPPHELATGFPNSPDVTLVVVAGAGHSHNAFPARLQLWDRIGTWAAAVPGRRQGTVLPESAFVE